MTSTNQPKWDRCKAAIRSVKGEQMALHEYLKWADAKYGTSGEYVRLSGGACPSWPDADKRVVRDMNNRINEAWEEAEAALPKYGRMSTLRALYRSN